MSDPDVLARAGFRAQPLWRFIIAGWLFVAVLAGAAGMEVWRSRARALDMGDRELALLATAAAEHVAGAMQVGQRILVLLESTHVLTTQDANRAAMALLQRQMADAPQLETLLLYDASGHLVASSLAKGAASGHDDASISELPSNVIHGANASFVILLHGRPALAMGRVLHAEDGQVLGTGVAVLDTLEFDRAFHAMAGATGATLAILDSGGATIAAEDGGHAAPAAEKMRSALHAVERGPLQVRVTRSQEAMLAAWRRTATDVLLRTALLSVLAVLLMTGAVAWLRRLEAVNRSMRASELRWRTVFENAPVGILVLHAHGRYLMANPAFQNMVGYSNQELAERRAFDITHPDDRLLTQEHIDLLVRGDRDKVRFQKRYVDRSGKVVWTDMSVARVFARHQPSEAGSEDLIIATVEDITQRLADEQDRRRLESQLRQSQKLEALGTFAGGVAHDFNNILGAILGFGERSLVAVEQNRPARQYIEQVMRAGERARLLVERILTFSRSGLTAQLPVDVRAVVEETAELLKATLPTNVTLNLRITQQEAYVLGDATHLHQVVMNLCSNAVHAMPQGGTLELEVERIALTELRAFSHGALDAGNYVRLGVADDGVGIAPDVLERMFNPFFTTRRAGEGTGLGLSLVDGIVREHGGAVHVASKLGHGSRFDIYLPVTDVRPVPSQESVASLPHGSGQVILLVDDEEALLRLGEEVLAELGYEPVGFSSSEAAWEALQAAPERFDAVISDHTMPGLTGVELAARIAGAHPRLPVILCSGFSTPALEREAAAIGVKAVLRKPVRTADLATALAQALP
ncbi:ATP-binding protein [Ralstonia insidiosa]|uniref:ATP-binding protein n=2 Tax=Ralstonia TaxID=48736 RepID=UPI000CEEFBBC|nr:ATP-binding protein [Ralstonia insidiosa]